MATLTIQRDRGWADKLRKYRILVDDQEIGQIGQGETLQTQLDDGPHVIQAKIDWCGSHPYWFEHSSKDQVILVGSALQGWRVWLASFNVFFNKSAYLTIEMLR